MRLLSEIDDFDREEYLSDRLFHDLEQRKSQIEERQPVMQERKRELKLTKDPAMLHYDEEAASEIVATIRTDLEPIGGYGSKAIIVYVMGEHSAAYGMFDQTSQICLMLSVLEVTKLFWPDANQFSLYERYTQATAFVERLDRLIAKASTADVT